ncbi:hypothetical protein CSQ96_02660 [Janthinobacterium sp. BJB412]|nr:hypothetical protein CSQ96_02660 [Janthinobacterium sp. BJB412]
MLALDDPRWDELDGGYRCTTEAPALLAELQSGEDVWDALWEDLHHQGDVGIGSYAAVPQLVRIATAAAERDWNFYGLIATIEVERHGRHNPALPQWLAASYADAWKQACLLARADLAADLDGETVQAILAVLALAKGELKLGALIAGLDSSEIGELLDERLGWSENYREQ